MLSHAPEIRGRFAPSPTGSLHVGNARTALLAWLDARSRGGLLAMRVEDLDSPRVRPGLEARILGIAEKSIYNKMQRLGMRTQPVG